MKFRNSLLVFGLVITVLITYPIYGQPKISFSFDDGSTADAPGYSFQEWNSQLLKKLKEYEVGSILFLTSKDKSNAKGLHLLKSWNDGGHLIANHTKNHPNFNNPNVTVADFKGELLSCDSLINEYPNYVKLFRFPYLKEGESVEKVDQIRSFLKSVDYHNGYVTIDASDWYIHGRLVKRLREDPSFDISNYRKFYLEHIWERANFYEKLSYELNGRHINHTLLLHHNLTASLFIDDLIEMFKEKGWQIVSAKLAYGDPIFSTLPSYAGESIIYALAKDTGKYENRLRYPAEDSRYEKERMDELGL